MLQDCRALPGNHIELPLFRRLTPYSALAHDPEDTKPLEDFWHEQTNPPRPSPSALKAGSSKGHSRARALSTLTAVLPSDQSLPPSHPARSIMQYISIFGPLVYRMQQAALLRKRILFVGAPPVRTTCEFGGYNRLHLAMQLTFPSI